MPHTDTDNCKRLPPLDSKTPDGFKIGKFAREWLSRAARPSFRYIAPGLSAFTTESFLHIYGAKQAGSYRWNSKSVLEEEEFSSLILPSDLAVPEIVSSSTNFESSSFDKDYGVGKSIVARRAGLYTDCLDYQNADAALLIHPSGLDSAIDFNTLCPWDQGRRPRLAEILQKWITFVCRGWCLEHQCERS